MKQFITIRSIPSYDISFHYIKIIWFTALSNAYQLLHFSSRAISHMLSEYQDYIEKRTQDIFKNFKDDNVCWLVSM